MKNELTIQQKIEQIRQQLINLPAPYDALALVEQIKVLQAKLPNSKKERINDLRLAINYSRNRKEILNVFECMYAHREITAIYKSRRNLKPVEFQLLAKTNLKVQVALAKAANENYKKSYDY